MGNKCIYFKFCHGCEGACEPEECEHYEDKAKFIPREKVDKLIGRLENMILAKPEIKYTLMIIICDLKKLKGE